MSTLNLALCTIFSFLPESSRSTVFAVCKQWRASYKYVNPTSAYCCSVLNGDFVFARVLFELFCDQIVPSSTTRNLSCVLGDSKHFSYFALRLVVFSPVDKQYCIKQAVVNFNQSLLEAVEKVYFADCRERFVLHVRDCIEERFHDAKYYNVCDLRTLFELVKWLLLTSRTDMDFFLQLVCNEASPSGCLDDIFENDDLSDLCTFLAQNNLLRWKNNYEFILMFSQQSQCAFDLFCNQLEPESKQVYTAFGEIAPYIDGNESKMDRLLQLGQDTAKRGNLVKDLLEVNCYKSASVLVVNYDFPLYLISDNLIWRCVHLHYCEELILQWIKFQNLHNRHAGFDRIFENACLASRDRVVRTLLTNYPQYCHLAYGCFGGGLCRPDVAIALLDHPNLPYLQYWMRQMLDCALTGRKLDKPLAKAILNHPNFLNYEFDSAS
jgi:hypothetical protein